MWNLSCKIYVAANTVIALCLAVFLFLSPTVFFVGILISLAVSLPAIPALYSVFCFIQERALSSGVAWTLLLFSVMIISIMPVYLLAVFIGERLFGDGLLMALSVLSGFAGICFQVSSVRSFFKRVASNTYYEND